MVSELFARFQALPESLAATPILAIGLTLGAFFAGNWLFSRLPAGTFLEHRSLHVFDQLLPHDLRRAPLRVLNC